MTHTSSPEKGPPIFSMMSRGKHPGTFHVKVSGIWQQNYVHWATLDNCKILILLSDLHRVSNSLIQHSSNAMWLEHYSVMTLHAQHFAITDDMSGFPTATRCSSAWPRLLQLAKIFIAFPTSESSDTKRRPTSLSYLSNLMQVCLPEQAIHWSLRN